MKMNCARAPTIAKMETISLIPMNIIKQWELTIGIVTSWYTSKSQEVLWEENSVGTDKC